MPKRQFSIFPNCSVNTKEIFGDAKFKYDKNRGERMNIKKCKKQVERKSREGWS